MGRNLGEIATIDAVAQAELVRTDAEIDLSLRKTSSAAIGNPLNHR